MKPVTAVLPFALLVLLGGCADDFIEPDCSGHLNTVIKGQVRGLEVDIESREVAGALTDDRMYLAFPAPESALEENQGNWLIDFGRNPLGGVATLTTTLLKSMDDWHSQTGGPKPFRTTSRDQGVACEVRRGEFCGGFGADPNGDGVLAPEQTNNVERYHRFIEGEEGVGSGSVAFDILKSEELKATFDVRIDADELEPTILGGQLKGCFYALLVRQQSRHNFAAPTTK